MAAPLRPGRAGEPRAVPGPDARGRRGRGRAHHANAPALLFKGATLTCADLDRLSDRFAAGLRHLGVARGFYPRVKHVQPRTPLRRVIAANIKYYFPPLLRVLFTLVREKKDGDRVTLQPGDHRFTDLLTPQPGDAPAPPPPGPRIPAVLLMSGRTTGVPKGVVGTHQAYVTAGMQIHAWIRSVLEPGASVIMLPLPLFHVYGHVGVQSLAFLTRNAIALVPNPRDRVLSDSTSCDLPYALLGRISCACNSSRHTGEPSVMLRVRPMSGALFRASSIVILTLLMSTSCTSPSSPAAPSVQSQPRVVTEIRVRASDTAFRPLEGARIEIVSGTGAGTTVMTGPDGDARFTGQFAGILVLRASKDGLLPATRQFTTGTLCATCPAKVNFSLESPETTLTLAAGAYRLTIEAGTSCPQLPTELRVRTYPAIVERGEGEFAGSYVVIVPGLLFLQDRFLIGLSGDYLATEDGGSPTLFEPVPPDTYLGIDFLIRTTDFQVVAGGLSIPFTGDFHYCTMTPGAPAAFCDFVRAENLVARDRCWSADSVMTLVRQ